MTLFTDLGLAEPLLRAVAAEGYESATPIQAAAIPALLAGRDVVGLAQTGTGKTAAFVLPTLNHLIGMQGKAKPRTCRALIVAPTRELAAQIADSVKRYSRFTACSVGVVVGGAAAGPQIKALNRGLDVLVATPGRLLDHMSSGVLSLSETGFVVLDEADQMMDMGFIPAIRRIMKALPAERQTLLFSATMPKEIRSLADDFLAEPEEIAVARVSTPVERIQQKVVHTTHADKRDCLLQAVSEQHVERCIVFTRTKHGADKVARHLENYGVSVAALHGNKSQGQRDRALGGFRNGKIKVLVATDIASRGIDVDDVSLVVNFDLPYVPEAYVHRIGRTARAGKEGEAVAFCDPEEIVLLRAIEKLIGTKIAAEGDVPEVDPRPAKRGRGGRRSNAPGVAASPRRSDGSRGGAARGNGNGRPAKPREDRPAAKANAGGERAGGERSAGERAGGGARPPRRGRGGAEAADGDTRQSKSGHAPRHGAGAAAGKRGKPANGSNRGKPQGAAAEGKKGGNASRRRRPDNVAGERRPASEPAEGGLNRMLAGR